MTGGARGRPPNRQEPRRAVGVAAARARVLARRAGAAGRRGANRRGQPAVIVVDEGVSSAGDPTRQRPVAIVVERPIPTADASTRRRRRASPPTSRSGRRRRHRSRRRRVFPPASPSPSLDAVTVTQPPANDRRRRAGVAVGTLVRVVPPAGVPGRGDGECDGQGLDRPRLAATTIVTAGPNPALAGAPVQLQASVASGAAAVGSGSRHLRGRSDAARSRRSPSTPPPARLTARTSAFGRTRSSPRTAAAPAFLAGSATTSEGIYDYALAAGPDRTVLRAERRLRASRSRSTWAPRRRASPRTCR